MDASLIRCSAAGGPHPDGTGHAQSTLRVLRYTPADTGPPGSLITATFDRPVAGMLDRSVAPQQVMRIEPAIAGTVAWRDPATVRFVPDAPFTPGARITVFIDTAAAASGGTRSAAPYQFEVRFPGPTPLAMTIDGLTQYQWGEIGPRPTFRLRTRGATM